MQKEQKFIFETDKKKKKLKPKKEKTNFFFKLEIKENMSANSAYHSNSSDEEEEEECSTTTNGENGKDEEKKGELDIVINNVVSSFNVRCHLNLRDIALRGLNVEYRKESGMITMKLRQPYTTASMWSSGKITCTGANSEDQARVAARRYARVLQKLGFNTRFRNYRVVNVLGTCSMPFAIKITQFSQHFRENARYEPELHPGVTYKIKDPKATLKIFSTGSVTVTAPCVANVQAAIEHIYPLVEQFQKPKSESDKKRAKDQEALRQLKKEEQLKKKKQASAAAAAAAARKALVHSESESESSEPESDQSADSDDSDKCQKAPRKKKRKNF